MANTYKERPSQILNLEDEYTSFCFDQACAYIIGMLESGEKPIFKGDKKNYNKPSDFYSKFEHRKE